MMSQAAAKVKDFFSDRILPQRPKKFFIENVLDYENFLRDPEDDLKSNKPPTASRKFRGILLKTAETVYFPPTNDEKNALTDTKTNTDHGIRSLINTDHLVWYSLCKATGIPISVSYDPTIKNFANLSTPQRIWYNYIGWNSDNVGSWLTPVPHFLFNTVRVLAKTLLSVMKFFGEFLPGVLEDSCLVIGAKLLHQAKNTEYNSLKVIFGTLCALSLVGYFSFKALRLFDRAVLDPPASFWAAWEAGKTLGGFIGHTLGVMTGIVGVGIAVTVWTFAFPLGLKMAALHGPGVVATVAQHVLSGMNSAASWIASTPVLQSIASGLGAGISHVVGPIFSAAATQVPTAVMGAYTALATAATFSWGAVRSSVSSASRFMNWVATKKSQSDTREPSFYDSGSESTREFTDNDLPRVFVPSDDVIRNASVVKEEGEKNKSNFSFLGKLGSSIKFPWSKKTADDEEVDAEAGAGCVPGLGHE